MQTKEKRIYYLTNDLVFKYIFGTQENVKYVRDLLESFYNLKEGSLKDLKILNSVKLNKKIVEEKNFEVDVLVELANGELINLEMYNIYDINAEKKSMLYISKVFGSKALKTSEKYNLVRKASQINFVRKDYVHNNKKLIRKYTIINEEDITDRIVPDLFQIYIINIDEKEETSYTNINKRFKLWLELLNCESKEKLDRIAKKDKILEEVVKKMKEFAEEEWIQDGTSRDRLIASQYETKIENAIETTKIETELESKKEIAKALLEDTKDVAYVSKITKLSIEEIEKLI